MSSIFLPELVLIHLHSRQANEDLSDGGYSLYLVYPFCSLMGWQVLISPRAARSRRVPTLGGYGEYNGVVTLLLGCFSGMAFGGIHCLGWNFLFQRHIEQILWRTASLAMVCAPLSFLLYERYKGWLSNSVAAMVDTMIHIFWWIIVISSSLMCIAARVTLIARMLLNLPSSPPGVYDTVVWTTFIPHW